MGTDGGFPTISEGTQSGATTARAPLGAGGGADQGGAGVVFDVAVEVGAEAEREEDLGDYEHGADEQSDEVIDKGGLFALEVVTDELNDPADDEAA